MNRYGYGTMMDDYVFLEEGKRRVESWGKGIEGMKQGAVSGKCAALRRALRGLGVRVDFLPEGMERRRKNQSHYNPKYARWYSSFTTQTLTHPIGQTSSSSPSNSNTPRRHRAPGRHQQPQHIKCKTFRLTNIRPSHVYTPTTHAKSRRTTRSPPASLATPIRPYPH